MTLRQPSVSLTIGADGTASVPLRTTTDMQTWTVTQVSVQQATAPAGATCQLSLNGVFVSALIPTGDSASGDPPVMLRPEDVLTVDLAGCTPGEFGTVIWFYDDGVSQ